MIVSAYRSRISPCIDCRHCWTHDACAVQDDMQTLYAEMDSYDNVIIASPTHFTELSGMLLAVTSRLQMYWCARFFRNKELIRKRKNGVLILTGGGNANPAKPLSTARTIFNHLNADFIDHIDSLKTNDVPTREDRQALDKAKELALRLNALYEEKQSGLQN